MQPTSLLKDRVREIDGNPDFSTKDISTSQAPVVSESNARVMSPMNQFELQNQVTQKLSSLRWASYFFGIIFDFLFFTELFSLIILFMT